MTADLDWIESIPFRDPQLAREWLQRLQLQERPDQETDLFRQRLRESLPHVNDPDAALANLGRWLEGASNAEVITWLLHRSPEAVSGLLQMLSRHALARHLIADPMSAEVLRPGSQSWMDAAELSQHVLVAPLLEQLRGIDQWHRAAVILRRFYSRQLVRLAVAEFVVGITPDRVGRQLARVTDATIEGALQFVTSRLAERRGMPQRADGSTPRITVLGLGNLGGNELSYSSPIKLVFLYDAIDEKNVWHRDFYHTLVGDVVHLLQGDKSRTDGMDIDLRDGPRHEVGVPICSFRQAARTYETSGRIWQRLSFVKARVVAGSTSLGEDFLQYIGPWIYRPFMNRVDLAEMGTLSSRIQRRGGQQATEIDVVQSAGGRDDVELTIQFLQLLHGALVPAVRCGNTNDAIMALAAAGCLTLQESNLLQENYARLCRLQHQLAVMFDRRGRQVPTDPALRRRLAWHLGVTTSDASESDLDRFDTLLRSTLEQNRKVINHLILDAPDDGEDVAIETALILDPDPDPIEVEQTLHRYGLASPNRALDDLRSLATETVPFLSPHRCRHFLSAIAPALLEEISTTPFPDRTLSSLDIVADSLGAKATLWELLAGSRPTMRLLIRLCAGAPYLTEILTNNPGMIDELIDSLLTDRLPSAQRLEALSLALCRGASDIERILHSFKSGAHLMIGVRDVLGKESLESSHRALCDTAESCLRRIIEHEQEELAQQYGDPIDNDGNAAEMVAVAVGKLGGREPNYHSDLDLLFLYSAEGETQRRVGGHRQTLTNQVFFDQLADRVANRFNGSSKTGRLYELDLHLRTSNPAAGSAMSAAAFFRRFTKSDRPLLEKLELCRARPVSGSRPARLRVEREIERTVTQLAWQRAMVNQMRQLRGEMESTAHPTNMKRGRGGTLDVELLAQLLALKYASESTQVLRRETVATLTSLADGGYLAAGDASKLIGGYGKLRRIEANLRLMNTPRRHELPIEDSEEMRKLAYLMDEADPESIIVQCEAAREQIRNSFESVLSNVSQ